MCEWVCQRSGWDHGTNVHDSRSHTLRVVDIRSGQRQLRMLNKRKCKEISSYLLEKAFNIGHPVNSSLNRDRLTVECFLFLSLTTPCGYYDSSSRESLFWGLNEIQKVCLRTSILGDKNSRMLNMCI